MGKDDKVIFGSGESSVAFKSSTLVPIKNKGTYHSLDSIVYLVKHSSVKPSTYITQSKQANITPVSILDHKKILEYIKGTTDGSNILSDPSSVPKPQTLTPNLPSSTSKKRKIHQIETTTTTKEEELTKSSTTDPENTNNKNNTKQDKVLDEPATKKSKDSHSTSTTSDEIKPATTTTSIAPTTSILASGMTMEQIAALKARRLAKKQESGPTSMSIEGNDKLSNNIEGVNGIEGGTDKFSLVQSDAAITKGILSHERQLFDRTSILQSQTKTFENILEFLRKAKRKQEAAKRKSQRDKIAELAEANRGVRFQNKQDQDQFRERDAQTSALLSEYGINPQGSFQPLPTAPSTKSSSTNSKGNLHSSSSSSSSSNINNNNSSSSSSKGVNSNRSSSSSGGSRVPIIIVPSSSTARLNMYNVKKFLEEGSYVRPEEMRAKSVKKESKLMINRKSDKAAGGKVPWEVIDNISKLKSEDWSRVVAVFVAGPEWQFKGWPYASPVHIFSKILAFNLTFDDEQPPKTVQKWSVKVVKISKNQRHLDTACVRNIWNQINNRCASSKSWLRYK